MSMEADVAIQEFYDRKAMERTEGTARRYKGCVKQWRDYLQEERDKSLWDANRGDLRLYLRGMVKEDYAPDTIDVTRAAVSQFYQKMMEAREEGLEVPEGVENPAEDLDLSGWSHLKKGTKKSQEIRKEFHYLKPKEVSQLVENVPNPTTRNELMVRLLFQTGVRRGELAEIRLEDIDRQERSIQIRAEKTEENRKVWYQPSLDTLMTIWIEAERNAVLTADESEYLFPTKESVKAAPYTITRVVKTAAENAGLQAVMYTDKNGNEKHEVTAHTLRHSFAVQAIKDGMDTRRLQKALGHSKIETTERYLQVTEEDVRDAWRRHGPSIEG